MMYVCGDSGPFDEFNPSFVARQKLGLELLYVLNKHPMNMNKVCSTLKISRKQAMKLLNSWARINAIREESSDVYRVNFAIFTKEDLMILARVSEPIARELAGRIGNHAKRITSLAKDFSAAKQVQIEKLLFAALGCFILDWLGLKTLEGEKLLVRNKPQPGNRNYLLFAREEVNRKTALRLYDKMYWGSHSDTSDAYTFTSFGDHHGMRYAFPDVLWTLQASPKAVQTFFKSPSWMTEKLSTITQLCSKKMLRDTAFLLFRLNAEGTISAKELTKNNVEIWVRNLVHLLEDMNYIFREKGRLKLNYPIFADDDKKIVEQIADIILPLVTQTIRQNYSILKRALSNTTPVRNKVALNEVLNEAWHWIFAQTNKILAEKGFLYDPPKKRAEEARYIAWVAKFSFP
jgi:hypothetical protein